MRIYSKMFRETTARWGAICGDEGDEEGGDKTAVHGGYQVRLHAAKPRVTHLVIAVPRRFERCRCCVDGTLCELTQRWRKLYNKMECSFSTQLAALFVFIDRVERECVASEGTEVPEVAKGRTRSKSDIMRRSDGERHGSAAPSISMGGAIQDQGKRTDVLVEVCTCGKELCLSFYILSLAPMRRVIVSWRLSYRIESRRSARRRQRTRQMGMWHTSGIVGVRTVEPQPLTPSTPLKK